MNNEELGVLWFDAHADFNTMNTYPSCNIYGVPVSVLCGHTLNSLSYENFLKPSQFAYYGIRDIDALEFQRLQHYNMITLDNEYKLVEFINNFDKIHLTFDMDCIGIELVKCVNTPVKNGPSFENIKNMLSLIKKSKKLMSMDLVEYNPEKGNDLKLVDTIIETVL